MHKQPKQFLIVLAALLTLILASACGSEPEATATPTKTPVGAGAQAANTPEAAVTPTAPTTTEVPTATTAANAAPAAPQTQTIVRINTDLLNVRSAPDITGEILATVNTGDTFTLIGRNQDNTWVQIGEDGRQLGWVAAEFVEIQTDVPVTQTQTQTTTDAQPTAAPVISPATGAMLSPDFGGQAFLWWRPEVAHRDLQLMREGGFNWVKQAFAWETIERSGKGQFDWSIADRVVSDVNANGLNLLARLSTDPDLATFWAGAPPQNGDDFAAFAGAVAARYNCQAGSMGCIQAFQVWNEPNLAREWGGNRPNPAEYVEFLRKAYTAIKAGNPNAIVISAGMAPTGDNSNVAMPDDVFYDGMYQAMGSSSNGYFDMLGVHGAGFAAPPELDPAEAAANPKYGGYRFFAFRHVEDIRAIMVQYGDTNKKIVLLEFGWTTDSVNAAYKWHGADAGITDVVQAEYLRGAYQYAAANWQPWIGLMSLLTMPNLDWTNDGNPQDEEQYWWAIMNPTPVDQLDFRAAYIFLCDYFNRQRGQFCPYDPARQ